MVSVNSGVSTLRVPSTVTAMKVICWRVITVHVKVKEYLDIASCCMSDTATW